MTDKVAVITGASSGMGLACARRLGKNHRLLIADINGDALDKVAADLRAEGGIVETAVLDVTQPESVAKLTEATRALGRFAGLVNAAGLSPTMADGRRVMAVNLVGTALVERALLPLAEEGSVAVLIASTAGHTHKSVSRHDAILSQPLADDFWSAIAPDIEDSGNAYEISKRGVILYCEAVAPEWGKKGGRVVSISPGLIETPMGKREIEQQPMMQHINQLIPLDRWGTADEIAALASFLISSEASYISGTDIRIDGGCTPVVNKLYT